MKELLFSFLTIFTSVVTYAQDWNYKTAGEITDFIGIVKVEGRFIFIESNTAVGKRFCADWLDKKLQLDGQKVKVSGIVGAIPSNVRMACTPLKITKAVAIGESHEKPIERQSTTFQYEKTLLKNVKATIKVLDNGEMFVIVPDINSSMRYISEQLPAEFKKDGLKVTFSGWEGIIPPNFRMMGKPLKLKSICITKAERKKKGLKKACYIFK